MRVVGPTTFFNWYINEHHHSGLGLLTSADVHFGRAQAVLVQRQQVLADAYQKNPERFVKGLAAPQQLPVAVWINPPRLAVLQLEERQQS
jgi:putative transposase